MDKAKSLLNQARQRAMYLGQIKQSIDLQVRYSMARRNSLNSKDIEADALTKAVLLGQRDNKPPPFEDLCQMNREYRSNIDGL